MNLHVIPAAIWLAAAGVQVWCARRTRERRWYLTAALCCVNVGLEGARAFGWSP